MQHNVTDKDQLSSVLLGWYDTHRRRMPWRALPGETADPYRVWLSEIMLQQTTVATVGPYFIEFLRRWPTIEALAAASLDDVLHAWQGLGYYARARNMHKCAQFVASELAGRFPETEAELMKLPGVGPYTAAAVAAIAFGRRAVVVDGNVERVMARMFAVQEFLPQAKTTLKAHADELTPDDRTGDYAQAVMDLGATVCTPKSPKCLLCPWKKPCRGRDDAESLPRRRPKQQRPLRRGTVFWVTRSDGALLLRRRPEEGLLGGLMEVPSTEWRDGQSSQEPDVWNHAPLPMTNTRSLPGVVRHGFTHFELELEIYAGVSNEEAEPPAMWCPIDKLSDLALPTLMKKVIAHGLKHSAGP